MGYFFAGAGVFCLGVLVGATIAMSKKEKV